MELDREAAVSALADAIAIRDFRRDSSLQEVTFKKDVVFLIERLKEAVREIGNSVPGHTLTLDVVSTFALFLKDKKDEAITSCYIDTSTSGKLKLKIVAGELEPYHEVLTVHSPSNLGIRWQAGELFVATFVLGDYIIQRMLGVATRAVISQTPTLEAGDGESEHYG